MDSATDSVIVDAVVVSNGEAVAQWHHAARGGSGLYILRYRFGRWWVDQVMSIDPATGRACCAFGMPAPLAELARAHLSVSVATTQEAPPYSSSPVFVAITGPARVPATPYRMVVALAKNDARADDAFENFAGRAPTEAESWEKAPGNSFFFFHAAVQSAATVHVQAGTTIDVWFPFVLDTSLRYSMTIAGDGFTTVGPLDGTFDHNTLHFVLPSFAAAPGAELHGEIDGDPR